MMEALIARSGQIARAAQRQRLEQIAASVRGRGLRAELGEKSVVIIGRRLVSRWLRDPLMRFIGKAAR